MAPLPPLLRDGRSKGGAPSGFKAKQIRFYTNHSFIFRGVENLASRPPIPRALGPLAAPTGP